MTLLSRDEVDKIRAYARQAIDSGDGNPHTLAGYVLLLIEDLAAAAPLIVVAPEAANAHEIRTILRQMAETHRGPVYVLPNGWCEADDEQRETLARRLRHVERTTREECAKIADGYDVVGEPRAAVAYQIAADIRAMNEGKP